MNEKRKQFDRDGFIVFESVVESDLIERLIEMTDEVLEKQSPEHFADHVSTGSMVLIDWTMALDYPVMAEFISHPNILAALGYLGFPDPRFGHGRIITKPPGSPALFWHEDGRFWNDPVSYTPQPIQAFLMFYLVDTTPANGCLRVIPGSHLTRHPLHDATAPTHVPELRRYEQPDNPLFSQADGEIDVCLKAGDFVMGHGSLLHSAHGNGSDQRRTCLTMWYYPAYSDLPERTQATVWMAEEENQLTESAIPEIEPLRIAYDGDAEPIELERVCGLPDSGGGSSSRPDHTS